MSAANEQKLCLSTLRQFTGTEQYYRHMLFSKFVYTDGVQYVAEKGGAYWLLDKIFACQAYEQAFKGEEFTVWELTKDEQGDSVTLVCTDGNETTLYSERITYTDFPLRQIRFYFQSNVLFLPSEY